MEATQLPASEVKVGDKLECEDGEFVRVARIRTANWIKDADRKPLLEFFADARDVSGFLIGPSCLVNVQH
jgi:hypothetical protein